MTRAHKQPGLRKPSDGATEMRAVDGKDLELITRDPAHPACRVHGLPVGRHRVGIAKFSEPRLAFGKFVDATKRHPRKVTVAAAARNRRDEEPHDRHRQSSCPQTVEENSHLHEKSTAGKSIFIRHRETPNAGCNSKLSTVARGTEPAAKRATQLRQ